MITITSSNSLSTVNGYQPTPAVQSEGTTSTNTSGSAPVSDTVQLSLTAQVTAMQEQGMSVTEIASSMGMTTSEVDTYLGIAAASSTGGGIPAGGGASHAPAPLRSAGAAAGSSSQPTKT